MKKSKLKIVIDIFKRSHAFGSSYRFVSEPRYEYTGSSEGLEELRCSEVSPSNLACSLSAVLKDPSGDYDTKNIVSINFPNKMIIPKPFREMNVSLYLEIGVDIVDAEIFQKKLNEMMYLEKK